MIFAICVSFVAKEKIFVSRTELYYMCVRAYDMKVVNVRNVV